MKRELCIFHGDEKAFGIAIIPSKNVGDNRGTFRKYVSGLDLLEPSFLHVRETFTTKSKLGVVRGMHIQGPPHRASKIISVVQGKILDIIVDIRFESKNYGKYMKFQLTERSESLLVPKGFAHGFQALSDETIILYQSDEIFYPECDTGFNALDLKHEWPLAISAMSDRDRRLVQFSRFSY